MMSVFFKSIRAAFVFLTRLPVGGFPYDEDHWRWSTAHFPLVGAVLGAIQGLVWMGLEPTLGPWPTAFFILGLTFVLTGGFHEDGLADTADAMGGAFDRETLFEILKDSRLGSFGALALIAVLGFRGSSLATFEGFSIPLLLLVSQSLSRVFPIWLMAAMPYATSDAEAKSRQVARASWVQAAVATGWGSLSLGIAWWLSCGEISWLFPAIALLLGAIIAAVLAWRFHVRAAGITGDFLGTTQQLCEVGILIAAFIATA